MTSQPSTSGWQQLVPYLADEILSAPKTWCDPLQNPSRECPDELERIVNYLVNNVLEKPWLNHLTLAVQVLFSHRTQHKTLMDAVCGLHTGFSQLFSALHLSSMAEWEVDKHLTLYLGGQLPETGSEGYRFRFWRRYTSASNHLKQWFSSLPEAQQQMYQRYVLPCASEPRELTKLSRAEAIVQEQKDKRKAETDALMPFYMDLRTQTHLRYNLVTRIYKAYLQAIQTVQQGKAQLPLEFELYEGGDGKSHPYSERLVFKLWDRRTFVLHHEQFFHEKTAKRAQKKQRAFSEAKNPYHLEFVRAEALNESRN